MNLIKKNYGIFYQYLCILSKCFIEIKLYLFNFIIEINIELSVFNTFK